MSHAIFNSMPSANFVYGNLSESDGDFIRQDSWAITQDGVKYTGTQMEVPELVGKMIPRPVVQPIDPEIAIRELAIARHQRWELLKLERISRTTERGVRVGGKWFQTDILSRSQYSYLSSRAAVLLASGATLDTALHSSDGPVIWKTMDNTYIALTINLISQLTESLFNQEALIFRLAEENRAALYLSNEPLHFVSTGWPATFLDTMVP